MVSSSAHDGGLSASRATAGDDPRRIVLFSPGLTDTGDMIWGEKIAVRSEARALEREFPGAEVLAFGREELGRLAAMRVDLLISYYTGPREPWRVDDVARFVDGVTLLKIVNHGELLDDFARIPVDGYLTNSVRAAELLEPRRPTAYAPLAVDDDYGPVAPRDAYRADVVFLGSGGRGNKQPATTRRYLEPAKRFDFALWGSWWDRDYWERSYRDAPAENEWHRFWRGPLPLDDIAALYSSAKIVLGYHEDAQREWGMWNNRVFEALGCGALLICDDAAGLRDAFGDGIVITGGGAETADLIAYYLAHPDERRRIGAIGRSIVRERYTYARWARTVRALYERLRAERVDRGGRARA